MTRKFRILLLVLGMVLCAGASYSQVKIGFWGDTIRKKKIEPIQSGLSSEQELVRLIGLNFPTPEVDYGGPSPKFWTIGVNDELIFSQVSLTHWAAGGSGSLAFNAYLNGMANYAKGKMF